MKRYTKKNRKSDAVQDILLSSVSRVNAYNKLAEYEDLEEKGLLVRLPCKVGTIVWTVFKKDWTAEYEVVGARISGYADYGDSLGLRFILPFGSPAVSLLNEDVFFTREEAEKRLKELKGGG